MKETKQINMGVVGCGYWGPNLIRNFRSLYGSCVKLACDTEPKRLAYIKELYPEIKHTSDFEELVKDPEIDAISIATPVWSHFELAKKSLISGKHLSTILTDFLSKRLPIGTWPNVPLNSSAC